MRKRLPFFLIVPMLVVIAWIVHFYPPHTNPYYPKCIFKKVTDLECPGCGSARSIYSVVHGDVIKAADHNILLLILIPVLVIGTIASFTNHLHPLWQKLNKPRVYLILVLVFWIARNINYYPFTVLHSDK